MFFEGLNGFGLSRLEVRMILLITLPTLAGLSALIFKERRTKLEKGR
jgi:hypothetical protein